MEKTPGSKGFKCGLASSQILAMTSTGIEEEAAFDKIRHDDPETPALSSQRILDKARTMKKKRQHGCPWTCILLTTDDLARIHGERSSFQSTVSRSSNMREYRQTPGYLCGSA
jgi:hypothetical protein